MKRHKMISLKSKRKEISNHKSKTKTKVLIQILSYNLIENDLNKHLKPLQP
jgi:hypothetical protein